MAPPNYYSHPWQKIYYNGREYEAAGMSQAEEFDRSQQKFRAESLRRYDRYKKLQEHKLMLQMILGGVETQ